MFIWNIKLNGNKIFKIVFAVVCIIAIIFFILSAIRIFKENSTVTVDDNIKQSDVAIIKPENYTNILRMVYENIDNYIGQKISFTGFIYRVPDISKTQFILARNMYIDETAQTVVVGFLCEYNDAEKFKDKTWIEITGCIKKGVYKGEIPILQIEEIKTVDKPEQEFVYPPDDTYIPTSVIL